MSSASTKAELEALMKQPGNTQCADCKKQDPDWASISLGVFLCIECSGIHRNLGSHISKVKSVRLDQWTPDAVKAMKEMGNTKAAAKWEQFVPATYLRPTSVDDPVLREQWIRAKYERKEFIEGADAEQLRNLYLSGRKEGFLAKKGKETVKWQKRWVVLDSDRLVYYIHEKDIPDAPKDTLQIKDTCFVVCAAKINRPYSFQLTHNRRNYFFCAENGQQLVDWMNAFRSAKAALLGLTDATTPEAKAAILAQLDQGIIYSGWLSKQSPKEKGWKKRYFALHAGLLMYFKSVEDANCLGFIYLGNKNQGFNVEENTKTPTGASFTLNTPGRAYFMQADTKEGMKGWMDALRAEIDRAVLPKDAEQTVQDEAE